MRSIEELKEKKQEFQLVIDRLTILQGELEASCEEGFCHPSDVDDVKTHIDFMKQKIALIEWFFGGQIG